MTAPNKTRAHAHLPVSRLEETFALHCRASSLPAFEREFVFARPRRFRADFAWPERMVLVEIEGGVWSGGRHTRGAGFTRDCEKQNLAALLGYRVFRFTGDQVRDGTAIKTMLTVFAEVEAA